MTPIAKIRAFFISNKIGVLLEYGGLCSIGILLAFYSTLHGDKNSLIITMLSAGMAVVILCLHNISIGYYGTIIIGFIIGSIDRMTNMPFPLSSMVLMLPYLIFFLLLVKNFIKKEHGWITWHPLVFFYFFSATYLLVEVFNPQMESFLGWLSYYRGTISYILLFFISLYIFKDLKKVRFYFKFIFVAIFLTGLYGCIQQWIGFAPFESRWLYSDPRVAQLYSLPGGEIRKFSFLTDPATYGTLMASGGVGSLLLIFGPFKKIKKILLLVISIIIFLGMSYSGTRTAYVMVPAGLGLFILMNIYHRRAKIMAMLGGIAFLIILYAPIYGNVTLNRVRSAFQPPSDDASYNIRTIHRHEKQPYMYQHPFGGGLNTTAGPGLKYNPDHYLAGFPPDSAYFSRALQTGWVGLMIECFYFFIILFYCVHYFYKCQNREIRIYYAVISAMLFSLMLGSYAQFTLSSMPQGYIFTPFLACIIKLQTFDSPSLSKNNP